MRRNTVFQAAWALGGVLFAASWTEAGCCF